MSRLAGLSFLPTVRALPGLLLLLLAGAVDAATFTLPGAVGSGPFASCSIAGSLISCPGNVDIGNGDEVLLSTSPLTLDIAGRFRVRQNAEVNVGGLPSDLTVLVGGNFDPRNGATLVANLTIAGDFERANDLEVTGDVDVGGDVRLGNGNELTGDLSADGDVRLDQDVVVDGNIVADDLTVQGSDSEVTGDVTADGDVVVNGTIEGSVDANGSVTVNSAGAIEGDVVAGGDVINNNEIGGSVDSQGNVTNNGSAEIGGDVTADGNVVNNNEIGGSVDSQGNVTNNGSAEIDGSVTAAGNVVNNNEIGGGVDAGGTVTNNGSAEIDGDVSADGGVTNNGTIDGNVESQGTVTNNGTISGDVNAPTVNDNGTVGGDVCDVNSNVGPCVALPPQLLAEYLFEEDPFTGTVADSSTNGFDGTAEGTTASGLVDPAVVAAAGESSCRYGSFPGGTSGVAIGNVDLGIGGSTELTVMAWIRWAVPPASADDWANIVTSNDNGDTGQFWLQHRQDNGVTEFAVQTAGGRTFVQASVPTVQDAWQHVAGVYDGSQLRIYVDGVLAGTTGRSGGIRAFTAATELNIGRWKPGGSQFRRFEGDIDEVRIFDGALSAAEIAVERDRTRPCPDLFPDFLILKSSEVLSDPVNAANNPKRIPGARIRYRIQVSNAGAGRPDAGSLEIRDALPAGVRIVVPASGEGVSFTDGSPASGVTFSHGTDVGYSSQAGGGPPYDHALTDSGDGTDPAVTGLLVTPGGRMEGFDGVGAAPVFELTYRVELQ